VEQSLVVVASKRGEFEISTIVTSSKFETRVFSEGSGGDIPNDLLDMLREAFRGDLLVGSSFMLSDGAGFETYSHADAHNAHTLAEDLIEKFNKLYTRTVVYVRN
jgi:hypothetical protein